ncbi:hypothetical protein RRG08_002158 [Elysia crispata]|uniref:Uncharacterized protein n=1 Tax=Elysia crispata TaxID=231223 RepID=A0AAE0ZCI8_9GAST|nr:hypothetical protein RRG08_002158 [Elysia crispata]
MIYRVAAAYMIRPRCERFLRSDAHLPLEVPSRADSAHPWGCTGTSTSRRCLSTSRALGFNAASMSRRVCLRYFRFDFHLRESTCRILSVHIKSVTREAIILPRFLF